MSHNVDKNIPAKNIPPVQPIARPKIFSSIKKVFTKPITNSAPKNTGLKAVLDKALSAQAGLLEQAVTPEKIPTPPPISLDALKDKMSALSGSASGGKTSKDRAASSEDMNKLKNLIQEKTEKNPSASSGPTASPSATPPPAPTPTPIPQKTTNEVPEDILRKVLE
jgi:hypothetical protein